MNAFNNRFFTISLKFAITDSRSEHTSTLAADGPQDAPQSASNPPNGNESFIRSVN